jgi:apolipoprotein D and lipocalin family protein
MKKWINRLVKMTFTSGLLMAQTAFAGPDLKPVSYVDLKRYMGDWNVIANIPNFIEKDCVSSVESYALREDGKIDNWFVCHKANGKQTRLTSLGWVVDPVTNAEWRIRFNLFGSIPFPISFSYVVIDLDPVNYSYTVVGHPNRSLLWIMAREKSIDPKTYQEILERVEKQGYDLSKIVKLPQTGKSTP